MAFGQLWASFWPYAKQAIKALIMFGESGERWGTLTCESGGELTCSGPNGKICPTVCYSPLRAPYGPVYSLLMSDCTTRFRTDSISYMLAGVSSFASIVSPLDPLTTINSV
jgi:hypothetical protein